MIYSQFCQSKARSEVGKLVLTSVALSFNI